MLTELCAELKNWFVKEGDRKISFFTISNGDFVPPLDIQENQYYRIIGSLYNDGVHKQGQVLLDETFSGAVWLMHVPSEIVDLADEITAYNSKYGEASPYTSESFGGYSYSKAIGANGASIGWRKAFAERLNRYRKI